MATDAANRVTEEDRELAELCDSAGADVLREGDFTGAGDLFDAADFWEPPSTARLTARLMLLSAALGRQESKR